MCRSLVPFQDLKTALREAVSSNYLGQAGHRSVHQVAAWLGKLPAVEGVSGPHGVRVLAGGGPHDVLHLLLGLLQQRYFVDI